MPRARLCWRLLAHGHSLHRQASLVILGQQTASITQPGSPWQGNKLSYLHLAAPAPSFIRWCASNVANNSGASHAHGAAPTYDDGLFMTANDHSPQHAVECTAEILQQVQVRKLKEELEQEADSKLHIPYEHFVQLAKSCNAATSDAEAEELCAAMHKAGVILRHHDVVYLRINEIADMVMMMLPGGKEDTLQKLAKIEQELAQLEVEHDKVHKQAHSFTNALLYLGFVVLCTQLVLMAYLTWWELSWDVMEPIGYHIGLFYQLVAYLYFMAMKGESVFDLGPFRDFWYQRIVKRKKSQLKFDEERYNYLCKLRDRYRKHAAHSMIHA